MRRFRLVDAFWTHMDRSGGPDACWLWQRGKHRGYGTLTVRGHVEKAHRYAYTLEYGPIPEGLHVLHKCDTPACCNPRHLYAGTAAQNVRDAIERCRRADRRGVSNPQARLTPRDVVEIRRRRAAGERLALIGADFGVTYQTIHDVATGKTWTSVELRPERAA